MKVYFLNLLFSLLTISAAATTYTFTGSGNWGNPANWQNGVVPPASIPSGSSIIINGNATSSFMSSGTQFYGLPTDVSLTISPGATLSLNLDKQFNLDGVMDVQGTFNDALISVGSGTVTIEGTYNVGYASQMNIVTVNNGGTFYNVSGLSIHQLTIQPGGNFINSGKVYGNAIILGNFQNSGILAPGNSPGEYDITGNYTAASTATHNFEVAGTTSSEYDRLLVSGNLSLNGTLNVSLINGFTPTTSHDLTIMTGTVSGTFSTVNIPSSYSLIYNNNSVVLRSLQSLPVTFINFDAKKEGNAVKLAWNVGPEINVSHYDIEKSRDGKQFSKIGSLSAAGQSAYTFIDQQSSNTIFYRIKSIDEKGEVRYSNILKLNGQESNIVLSAFPLPAKNKLILQHSTAGAGSRINLYSLNGKLLMTVVPEISNQQTTIDISNLKPGIYLLSYLNEKTREMMKIVKQ
jgi:hypothetical protein